MKGALLQGTIKNYINTHGIKQKYIADSVNMPETELSKKLNGKTSMSVGELVDIAQVLKVTPNDLLGLG